MKRRNLLLEELKAIDAHLIMAGKAHLRGEHTDAFEQCAKAQFKLNSLIEKQEKNRP